MKKFTFLFIVLAFGFSCSDPLEIKQDSPYKEKIISFLDGYSTSDNQEVSETANDLKDGIDFKNVSKYNLKTTEKLLIADVTGSSKFKGYDQVKALFYLNNDQLVRIVLATFENKKSFTDYNSMLSSIMRMEKIKQGYSGRYSLWSLSHTIMLFNDFENGKLIASGITRDEIKNDKQTRTKECLNWYLITTYYYTDHTTTDKSYLTTTCDCGDDGGGYGRVACESGEGGSTTSTGGPSFPSSASVGDETEFTDEEGQYTRWKLSEDYVWVVAENILPTVVVTAHPYDYGFAYNITSPYDGLEIWGPYDLVYTFNGGTGSWDGLYYVQNNVTDPCMKAQVQSAISTDVGNDITNIVLGIYNISDEVNIDISQTTSLASNVDAETSSSSGGPGLLNVSIELNSNTLPGASQEYILSTIFHELLHAVFDYNGITAGSGTQHETMATEYIGMLSSTLMVYFPNLSEEEATALSWGGLKETDAWYDLSPTTRSNINDINSNHRSGSSGTDCP